MANQTVYPFGPGGQLPSGIAIADDLNTRSANITLSAKQGAILGDTVFGREEATIVVSTTSCGGRITDAGIWSTTNNNLYYGAIVDVSAYRGRTLREVAGAGGSCAFIRSGFTAGAAVEFANGWSADQTTEAGSVNDFVVPDDAVYFYYYVRSDKTYYQPQTIAILAIQGFDDLKQALADTDEKLAEETSIVSGEIRGSSIPSCGGSISNENKWASVANYYGGVVDVRASRGHVVKILANASNGGSYTFLKQGFTAIRDSPDYASGYNSTLPMTAGQEYDLVVPDDAVYLYVYLRSLATDYTPQTITMSESVKTALAGIIEKVNATSGESLSLFSYNIGHFSLGVQKNSTITASDYASKVDAFRALLSAAKPDIYGLLEYSATFGKNTAGSDVLTKDELFSFMQTEFESNQKNYACYALFGAPRIPIYNVKTNDFDCLANETITHTSAVKAEDYRYISADLYAFGVSVKLVVTHLAFDTNRPGVLQEAQINELLSKYDDSDYVIMMGDWNYDDFSQFTDAGYSLANDGTFKTYPAGGTALDNICVKGLKIANTKMIASPLSDHYPLLCRVYM